MVAVTFDTHKFVRKLKESGFNDQQAEALTDAVQEAQASADVATKADLREYESAIRSDLEKLEMRLDAKFAGIDAKLEKIQLRLIIWLGSIVFVLVNAGPILPKLLHLG